MFKKIRQILDVRKKIKQIWYVKNSDNILDVRNARQIWEEGKIRDILERIKIKSDTFRDDTPKKSPKILCTKFRQNIAMVV